jgi:hypothetical protein
VVSSADPLRPYSWFTRPERGLVPENISICTDKQYEIARITSGAIKTLGSVNYTLHGRMNRFQIAPEETVLTEDGSTGRDIPREDMWILASEECRAYPFETGNRDDCSRYGLFG